MAIGDLTGGEATLSVGGRGLSFRLLHAHIPMIPLLKTKIKKIFFEVIFTSLVVRLDVPPKRALAMVLMDVVTSLSLVLFRVDLLGQLFSLVV